jgi:hypothetical protein
MKAGWPQVPYIRLLVAVPDSADLNITIYKSDYTLFEDYSLYPVPRVVFEDSGGCICPKEVYTYDTLFYQKDTLYPDRFYQVNNDGRWRDQRLLEVFLYPVQFNPQQEVIYFHNRLDLRIEYAGTVVENESGLGPFEEIGREILLNYPGIDRQPPPHEPPAVHYYTDLIDPDNIADYIIVTHIDFINNETASYWIYKFAEWRVDHNQFDVGVVNMSDVYDEFLEPDYSDSAKALREFLVYAYNHWNAPSIPDGHFAYCLFIGDWDYIPIDTGVIAGWFPPAWLTAFEGYYRDLSTPCDSIEDIMLGRWPVKETNVQDLITIAQKTINYEKQPDCGDWRRSGLLIAGDGSGFNRHVDSSKVYFSDISYNTVTLRYSEINDTIIFADSLTELLNPGAIIATYYDHGGPHKWVHFDTSSVKELKNEERLPVVSSHACLTAIFQWDHPFYDATHPYPGGISLGEHFLINPDGGAVAFYGATTLAGASSLEVGPEILARVLRYQHWILGKALIELNFSNNFEKYKYCLLGDPALDLGDYTAYPDLPDLVVRPRGIDISLLPPYPYPVSGDSIPIRARVLNIGGSTANDFGVKFTVGSEEQLIYDTTVTIREIKPRDSTVVTAYWHTALTHPEHFGEIGDCKFRVWADPDDVIEESWSYNNISSIIKKVVLYPSQPGWPRKVTSFSQPAIANLDGTDSVEIVYAGLDSLYIFNADGSGYSENWPTYFHDVYGVGLADVNGNGYIDIVAVSEDTIRVYFNDAGKIGLGWSAAAPNNYGFTGLPAIGYIQPSVIYKPDITMLARPNEGNDYLKVLVYDYDGTSPLYEWNTSGQVPALEQSGPAIENVLALGNNEAVVSYSFPHKTEVFNAQSPYLHLTLDDYGRREITPALADMNNDDHPDILVAGHGGVLLAYDAYGNETIWKTESMPGVVFNSPAVGNIHRFYPLDVEVTFDVSQGNNGRIRLVERVLGRDLSLWPYVVDGRISTSPALAKLEGRTDEYVDEYVDIVFGCTYPKVYALNWEREIIYPFPLPVFGIPNSPIIGEIDGDEKSETILSTDDGYLHVWENMNSSVTPYKLEWPQFHHDYQRTGLYGWGENE